LRRARNLKWIFYPNARQFAPTLPSATFSTKGPDFECLVDAGPDDVETLTKDAFFASKFASCFSADSIEQG